MNFIYEQFDRFSGYVRYLFYDERQSNTYTDPLEGKVKRIMSLKEEMNRKYARIRVALDSDRGVGLQLSVNEGLLTISQAKYLMGSSNEEFKKEYEKAIWSLLDKQKAQAMIDLTNGVIK